MLKLALAFACGLLAGCATRPASTGSTPPAPTAANYPFSEFETIYETVLTAMAPHYFEKEPDEIRRHTAAMEQFARTSLPKDEFVTLMTGGTAAPVFARARTDLPYRDTLEFKREFQVRVNVAVQMARIMFAARFNVYTRKIVQPDALTRELFPLARDRDDEECIAWIAAEVPIATVKQELGDRLSAADGDRFFAFGSPEWHWQQLAGRQGYLQVRGREIVAVHVTFLN